MSRIRILPDNLVNQIAAGEVVERPASVVKELLENALDAGAGGIDIVVEGGGRRRIRVSDDGDGLSRDEALLALERHATSKLGDPADLGRIVTLGFRGEALPAIASVSRMTLRSSTGEGAGTSIEVEGGRILKVSDAGHPKGTTVDVRDLFFNTPARAKFLRASATELGHVSSLVAACAVMTECVRVSLTSDGRKLIEAPPADDRRERIAQVYGAEWREAIPLDLSRGPLAVRGLIAPPATAASSRRMQHIYVNDRLVKDRLMGHAIGSACEGFFPKGRHAALFLFIECPPDAVDVNVHPAKAEVRFAASRQVHDLVVEAILTALRGSLPITALGAPPDMERGAIGAAEPRALAIHEAAARYLDAPPVRPDLRGRPDPAASQPDRPSGTAERGLLDTGAAVTLAHYRESYIVAADGQGLLLVDQHAAHERILFEQLLARQGSGGRADRQSLMFPVTVPAPRMLASRLEEVIARLDVLGFSAEIFGESTLLVREAPAVLGPVDLTPVITDLLDQMAGDEETGAEDSIGRLHKLVATVACHAAVKVRMPLTQEKMNYLIRELFRTSTPLKCPHGRPAILRFSHESIEQGFDRR